MNRVQISETPYCLAIIPARSGSKGIPQKNVATVGGYPLIAWTIAAALHARHISRAILTTDSVAIAEIGQQYGIEVPFLRPADLARDDTPGIEPILHAVRQLADCAPDLVVTLQPTSPLRTASDIDMAIELAVERQADAVVSVTPAANHPYWVKQVDTQGRISDFIKQDPPITRRQLLPPAYVLNGAIYVVRRDILLERQTFYTKNTYAYVMPPERSLDVDSAWDLHIADLLLADQPLSGKSELGQK